MGSSKSQACWRRLSEALPVLTLIDLKRYAPMLDALEESLGRSEAAHDGPTGMSPFGWGDPVIQDGYVIRVEPRPIASVKAADPTSLAVAALQRLLWCDGAAHSEVGLSENISRFYILYSMAERLLRRRLPLGMCAASDLARFAIFPLGQTGSTRRARRLPLPHPQAPRKELHTASRIHRFASRSSRPCTVPPWPHGHSRNGRRSCVRRRVRNAWITPAHA